MTINEIAEKAGVSIGTVDRVIHHRGRVAQETVARIEAIIERHGYTPNPIARELKRKKPFTIGIVFPELSSEGGYWKLLYQGILSAIKELNAFSIETDFIEFDRHLLNDCYTKTHELLDRHSVEHPLDALILTPVSVVDMIRLAPELEETPYVFVDSPFPDAKPLSVVAQNPTRAGTCAARLMSMLCPHGDRYAVISMAEAYNLKERSRAFTRYFEDSATVTEYFYDPAHHQSFPSFLDTVFTPQGGQPAQPSQPQHPEFSGIFMTYDAITELTAYLSVRGIPKTFALIGYDLLPQNRAALQKGDIDCIISQCPEVQGKHAVETLFKKCVLEQDVDDTVDMPIEIYLKENV